MYSLQASYQPPGLTSKISIKPMKPYQLLSYLLPFAIFLAVMTAGMTITDEQGGNTNMTKVEVKSAVPDWVVYPEKELDRIVNLDVIKTDRFLKLTFSS